VGLPHAFWTHVRLQQNAAMEQFASGPFARRHHFPQHTAFLIREGDTKFGHGGAPSPQTTIRGEKENRPSSTCQSKIAKLLGASWGLLAQAWLHGGSGGARTPPRESSRAAGW